MKTIVGVVASRDPVLSDTVYIRLVFDDGSEQDLSCDPRIASEIIVWVARALR